MRWPYKPATIYDRIKKRFALIPRVVENEWVWLESYYAFSWEDYGGCNTIRFNTYEAAKNWLRSWEGEDD
jgi:hypothetical protein